MGDGGPAPPELGALRAHVAGTSAGDGPRGLGGSGPWAPAAWRTALEALFLGAAPGAGREADDLVFLVRGVGEGGAAAGAPPEGWEVLWEVLVRRRGPAALLDLGQGVDWTRSFYLNVVLQARYQLTVALCQGADLERHRAGLAGPATPLMKVTRRVYASPSRVSVDPAAASGRAEAPPQPAYPDVFFFVPDFTDAFGDVVAARPSDQCLCVLLSCTGCGALDPGVAGGGGGAGGKWKKVCVFSGFVSQERLCGALDLRPGGGGRLFGGLLGGARGAPSPHLVRLQGPNNKGNAEVAVTEMPATRADRDTGEEGPAEGRGLLRRLGQAGGAGAGGGAPSGLQCCIMNVSIPWYHLASDLVLKGG